MGDGMRWASSCPPTGIRHVRRFAWLPEMAYDSKKHDYVMVWLEFYMLKQYRARTSAPWIHEDSEVIHS
jgi:hypothetical protein